MDRAKLAELRKKKAQAKVKAHKELLDSNASIKEAVLALNTLINNQKPYDDSKLIQQLEELKDSQTYGEDIKRLENALRESSNEKKLEDIIEAVGSINNEDVVLAVNSLITKMEDRTISQSPEDYQPVRRVRKIGGRLVYDDDPLQVSVMGGGGGRGVQSALIRNGNSLAVVNPDGTPIGGGSTPSAPTEVYSGRQTVSSAGDAEQLAEPQEILSVTIKALSTNTGYIYVGDSSVDSTNGFELSAGESVSMDIANLSTIYIDSSVNDEGVSYMGVN